MLDLLLELIGGILEFAWRFFVSVLATIGVIWLLMSHIGNERLAVAIAVPVGIIGICGGLYWQWRAG